MITTSSISPTFSPSSFKVNLQKPHSDHALESDSTGHRTAYGMEPEPLQTFPKGAGTRPDLLFRVTSNTLQCPALLPSVCRCRPSVLCAVARTAVPWATLPHPQSLRQPPSPPWASFSTLAGSGLSLSCAPIEFCASLITHSRSWEVLFNCILIFLEKGIHKEIISRPIIYE